MTSIILYENAAFGGASKEFMTPDGDLTNNRTGSSNPLNWNWNDEASSLTVFGGPVTFYPKSDFDGEPYSEKVPEGRYDVADLHALGIQNDEISGFSW
jgi:hypothetical protein